MQNILNKLLDVLFPPRESPAELQSVMQESLADSSGCHEGVFYCVQYGQPGIRSAVRENKFFNNEQAQTILATILTKWVKAKQLADICIVPIPLGPARLRERGHNQVQSILNQTSYRCAPDVLSRNSETLPQASLNRNERLTNIKGVFTCNTKSASNLQAKIVIILDDVTTTGATLNEARATLAPHVSTDTKLISVALAQ